jgi:microcystin-dependent protein
MASPFVGECRLVGFNFAPVQWSICNGQLLSISEFSTIFNLIGTTYGGNGTSNFALPNLQGRVPVHQGSGSVVGMIGGSETVTLTTQQMPSHNHPLLATSNAATSGLVSGNVLATTAANGPNSPAYNALSPSPSAPMNALAISQAGNSQPHDNLQPYLALNWIISLYGIYPTQG